MKTPKTPSSQDGPKGSLIAQDEASEAKESRTRDGKRVAELIQRKEQLAGNRRLWDEHWQELAELFLPSRAAFYRDEVPGEERMERVYDSMPIIAARGLAATLDGMLKPATSRWFELKASDEEAGQDPAFTEWLEIASERLWEEIYAPAAGFREATAEADIDLVVFGSGIVYVEERMGQDESRLLFRTLPLRDVYLAEGENGQIDTLFWSQRLTARQAAQRYGRDKLGKKTQEHLERGGDPERLFAFLQCVYPRSDHAGEGRYARPYASVHVDVESNQLIREGGFQEFPFAVGRWDRGSGETYGRSPAMVALGDARTANEIVRTLLEAGEKAVNPPLQAPYEGVIGTLDLRPASINYFDLSRFEQWHRGPVQPIPLGQNVPLGFELLQQTRLQIENAFFKPLLSMPLERPQMTATEVQARLQEMQRVIGPVFGRLETGYLSPMVERALAILIRSGELDPLPPALLEQRVTMEYKSPIQAARKRAEMLAGLEFFQAIQPWIGLDPAAASNIDIDAYLRIAHAGSGLPAAILKPKEEVAQTRAAMQQAAMGGQALAQAGQIADVAAKGAPALKEIEKALGPDAAQGIVQQLAGGSADAAPAEAAASAAEPAAAPVRRSG